MSDAFPPWMSQIHDTNPYKDFPLHEYTEDMQGWGSQSPIFEQVISKCRPQTIIEVGSWKGASAIHMAALIKQYNCVGAQVVCVDTWLGSVEHWLSHDKPAGRQSLKPKWGMPTIYRQFLANVILTNHTDIVVPFPVDSITAARFFQAKALFADAIYIDAAHEYESVTADLHAFWKLLRPGGVFFGDDYHLTWIGVVRAIHDFAEEMGLDLNVSFQDKWLVQKPR